MSLDFQLFQTALDDYTKNNVNNESKNICIHNETVEDNGIITCTECGEEIETKIIHDKEWRYYGANDSRKTTDPNRVHARKIDDKNIFKDVETMGFSETIVAKANELYNSITNGQIYRGNSRKAIIFACIYHSFKLCGKPQPHENLIKLFGLSKKTGLKGLKIVTINTPKESHVHTSVITHVNIMYDIMDKFKANQTQKDEVLQIYENVKNRSSKLNRSRPQSMVSGIIFYWIKSKKIDITCKEFAAKVDLSELTVTKMSKEVEFVLESLGKTRE